MTIFGKGFAALQLDHLERSTRHESLTGPAVTHAAAMRELPARYAEGLRALEDRLRAVDADAELSDQGKAAARTKAREAWFRLTAQLVTDAERRTRDVRQSRENRILPTPLHTDPAVAQARLGNARTDARMLFDAVKPTDLRAQFEANVGADADPAVRYLLLTTSWPSLYTSSRGAPGVGLEWTRDRRSYLAPLLGPDGRTALAELEGLNDALEIAPTVAALFDADTAAHGLRVPEPQTAL